MNRTERKLISAIEQLRADIDELRRLQEGPLYEVHKFRNPRTGAEQTMRIAIVKEAAAQAVSMIKEDRRRSGEFAKILGNKP